MMWLHSNCQKNCFEFIQEFVDCSWITALLFSMSQNTEIWVSLDTSSDGMGQKDVSEQERRGSMPTTQWPCHCSQKYDCNARMLVCATWVSTVRVYNQPRYCLIKAVNYYIFISSSRYSQVKKSPYLEQLRFPLHCRFIRREKPSHGRGRRSKTHSAWNVCQLSLLPSSVLLYLEDHCSHSRFIFL